jgi:hypothetical protein
VFAQSADRIAKERSMRRRRLKWLWARLAKLQSMERTRDALLMKLGSARSKIPAAWRLGTRGDPEIFHHGSQRIGAHVFIAFLAYCLYVTLGPRLKSLAPGLTARSHAV